MSSRPAPAFVNISPIVPYEALAQKAARDCVHSASQSFKINNQLIVMDAVGFFHIAVEQSSASRS